MYYSVKLNWMAPKEGSDEMQKQSKSFLVYAESVTEAEGKVVSWTPSNYQDAVVSDVKKTNIGEIRWKDNSIETFWLIKVMDDLDGTAEKAKPYYVIYDGAHLEDAVKKASSDWSGSEIEDVKKFKTIIDSDLIDESTVVVTRKKVDVSVTDDGDIEDEELDGE